MKYFALAKFMIPYCASRKSDDDATLYVDGTSHAIKGDLAGFLEGLRGQAETKQYHGREITIVCLDDGAQDERLVCDAIDRGILKELDELTVHELKSMDVKRSSTGRLMRTSSGNVLFPPTSIFA